MNASSALVEADRVLQLLVVEHRVGEPEHVEHDVEVLGARPGEDVLGVGMFLAKIVEAMPNEKFGCVFASACIASIVFDALSKPFLTVRTWSWTSPMPSSETRMLISTPLVGAELDDAREHRDGARAASGRWC